MSGNQGLNNGVAVTQLTIQGEGVISDQSYASTAAAANTLTKVGNGNLVLDPASANLYGGSTLVDDGNVIIQSAGSLGAAGVSDTQELFVSGVVTDLSFTFNGSAASVSVPYSGIAATDAAAIQAALAALTTISPDAVTVIPNGTGQFLIESAAFAGAVPALQATVTGTGSAYAQNVGTQELYINGAVNNVTTLTFRFNGSAASVSVPYTGVAATDAAAILAALTGLSTINPNAVSVTPNGAGVFLISSASLYGINVPMILPTITAGPGSAYSVTAGGTVIAAASILQLQSSLNAEPLFLFGNGVASNGHYTGALEDVSGDVTYTGTITLETNSTIGVASPNILTITSPIPNVVYGITDLGGGPSGEFSLTKEGTGTLILASTDAYEGGTTVNQGILNVQNNTALGTSATTTVVDRAQLQLQGGVSVTNQNLVLSGSGLVGTGALLNVSGNNTWGSPGTNVILTSAPAYGVQSTVTGNSTPTGTVAIGVTNPGDTLTIASPIGEAPAMLEGVAMNGAGASTAAATIASSPAQPSAPTLTGAGSGFGTAPLLAGNYYYVVTAVVNNGFGSSESAPGNQQVINVTAGSDVLVTWSPVTVPAGSTVTYNVYRSNVAFTFASPSLVAAGIVGTTYTDTGTAALPGTPPLTLASGLTKVGAGILSLDQNDTYRGSTFVQVGTLNVQNSNALGLNNGDAIQRLTVIDPVGTDSFTLTFNGQATAAIPFRSSASTVANDLNKLSSIGPGGVNVALNEVYSGVSTQETMTATGLVGGTAITAATWAGGFANITAANTFAIGQKVFIEGMTPAGYNGLQTIATASSTGFTYALGVNPGTPATGFGLVTPTLIKLTIGAASTTIGYFGVGGTGVGSDAANIQAALNALAAISGVAPFAAPSPFTGNVTVTADATDTIFTVSYGGALQDQQNAPTFTAAVSAGPGTVTTQVTQLGAGQPTDVYTITFVGAPPTTPVTLAGVAEPPIIVTTPANTAETAVISTVAQGGVGTVVSSGATLQLDASLGTISTPSSQTLFLNGGGVNGKGALRTLSGTDTWNGLVTLQTSSTFDAAPTTTLTIAGQIVETNPALIPPATLTVGNSPADTGLVVFTNANTYTGSTLIDAGDLNIQNPRALGFNTSAEQTVAVNGTAGSFTLGFTNYPAGVTTGSILTTTLTPATFNTALASLMSNPSSPGGGTGTAIATLNPLTGSTYTVTFGGSLAGLPVPLLNVQATQPNTSVGIVTLLNGGASSTIVANGATLQDETPTETSFKPLTLYGAGLNNAGALENVTGTPVLSTFVPSGQGLSIPIFEAFDSSGNLYVANNSAGTISKITPAGVVTTFASGLSNPSGLAFDSSGNLYVTNYAANTISKITPGGVVSTFVASGLNGPAGLAFDSSGNLYVADNNGANNVLKITPLGAVSTFVNSGLSNPIGLAFDSNGNLYVANNGLNEISEFSPNGTPLNAAFAAGLSGPYGLAFDSAGYLYVTSANTIARVSPAGMVSTFVSSGLSNPYGLAFDSSGNLYVANGGANTISKITIPDGSHTWGSAPVTLGSTASIAAVSDSALNISQAIVQSPVLNTPTLLNGAGTIANNTTYYYVITAITPSFNVTGTTNSSILVTGLSSTGELAVGMNVAGSGIQPGTTIQSINSAASSVILSLPATTSLVSTPLTFSKESIPSNEVNITTTAANQAIVLTWAAYPTATGYNLYRGTTAGGVYTTPALLTSIGFATTTTFTDVGNPVSAGASPASAAFGVNKIGPGTLVYSGAASNQYDGLTSVLNGTLQLDKTGGRTGTGRQSVRGRHPLAADANADFGRLLQRQSRSVHADLQRQPQWHDEFHHAGHGACQHEPARRRHERLGQRHSARHDDPGHQYRYLPHECRHFLDHAQSAGADRPGRYAIDVRGDDTAHQLQRRRRHRCRVDPVGAEHGPAHVGHGQRDADGDGQPVCRFLRRRPDRYRPGPAHLHQHRRRCRHGNRKRDDAGRRPHRQCRHRPVAGQQPDHPQRRRDGPRRRALRRRRQRPDCRFDQYDGRQYQHCDRRQPHAERQPDRRLRRLRARHHRRPRHLDAGRHAVHPHSQPIGSANQRSGRVRRHRRQHGADQERPRQARTRKRQRLHRHDHHRRRRSPGRSGRQHRRQCGA